MPKYYSLLYINCDSPRSCNVLNIVRIHNKTNIYDHLTKAYLDYKKTTFSGPFYDLCCRLDHMIETCKYEDKITHKNVRRWIKNSCSEDNFDKIYIEKHKLCTE